MGQNKDNEQMAALGALIDHGVIDEVLGAVKSGKEATVYCCTATLAEGQIPGDLQTMAEGHRLASGETLVAAKVYRSTQVRQFSNAASYNEGRLRERQRRETRAMENKSRFGKRASFSKWVADEYETLQVLHTAGVAVPRPIAQSESIIVMEYIGGDDRPALVLNNAHLDQEEARRVFELLMLNIERALAADRIHGDLSPFNVLYHEGDVRMIDFPQAVDPRFNSQALPLLERDIANICRHFARYGIEADQYQLAHRLWARFLRSDL